MFRVPKRLLGFLPILPERAEGLLAAAQAATSGGGLGTDEDYDPTEPRRRTAPKAEAETFEEVREEPAGSAGKGPMATGVRP